MSSNSDGSWPRNMPEAFRRRGNDETWVRACRSITATMLTGMFDTVLPTAGSTFEEGLTFRPEGQPGLRGGDNVRLVAAPGGQAPIDGTADAALFCAVHDVMQSWAALEHVFDHPRPGRRSPPPAGSGRPHGWGHCERVWPTCTCLLSPTSATSTDHGGCWPSSRPTCGSTSWRSVPDT
jgi:hypothetical protein